MATLIEHLENLSKEKREYIFDALAVQLAESGKLPQLIELLLADSEWLEAKADYLKTDGGFTRDVQIALDCFDDPLLPDQMPTVAGLTAAQQIVGQRANTYNDYDLQTLVWLDQTNQAIAAAQLRTRPLDRFNGLLSIHTALRRPGDRANKLLDELCKLLGEITFAEDKAIALRTAAVRCAEEHDPRADTLFEAAIEATLTIHDILRSPYELYRLAEALIQFEHFDQAQQVALSIKDDPRRRNLALKALAEAQSNEGQPTEAATTMRLIPSSTEDSQPNTTDSDYGKMLLTTTAGLQAIMGISEDRTQADRLDEVVDNALRNHLFEDALNAARTIRLSQRQARALSRISLELAKAKHEQTEAVLMEARDVAFTAENLSARIIVLGRLAAVVENTSRSQTLFQIALELIAGIPKSLERTANLLELANTLWLTQDARAHALIDQARQIVIDAAPSRDRDAELDHVVRMLTRVGRVREVETVIECMTDDFNQANAFTAVGHILLDQGDPQAAVVLKKARQATDVLRPHGIGPMNSEEEPALALSHLAGVLTLAGESDADEYFEKALACVDTLQDRYSWSIASGALVEALYRVGRFQDAADLRSDLLIYEMKSSIDNYEVEALIREGRFTEAIEILDDIQEEQFRQYSRAAIAEQLVKNGCAVQGLSVLGARSIDEFLSLVANYTWPPEKKHFCEMLGECIHIAAWIIPFWKQIERLLVEI